MSNEINPDYAKYTFIQIKPEGEVSPNRIVGILKSPEGDFDVSYLNKEGISDNEILKKLVDVVSAYGVGKQAASVKMTQDGRVIIEDIHTHTFKDVTFKGDLAEKEKQVKEALEKHGIQEPDFSQSSGISKIFFALKEKNVIDKKLEEDISSIWQERVKQKILSIGTSVLSKPQVSFAEPIALVIEMPHVKKTSRKEDIASQEELAKEAATEVLDAAAERALKETEAELINLQLTGVPPKAEETAVGQAPGATEMPKELREEESATTGAVSEQEGGEETATAIEESEEGVGGVPGRSDEEVEIPEESALPPSVEEEERPPRAESPSKREDK